MKSSLILLIAVSFFVFNSCSPPNCANNKSEYQEGYAAGKLTKTMGGAGSCSEYVNSYNEQTGRNTMHATDCFCNGFEDGLNGNNAKY